MAFPSPSRPCCPIRIVSVHLLDATGQLLRVLFLDREGHISAQPHYVPRAEALILASNQQIVLGPQAPVAGALRPWPEAALVSGLSSHSPHSDLGLPGKSWCSPFSINEPHVAIRQAGQRIPGTCHLSQPAGIDGHLPELRGAAGAAGGQSAGFRPDAVELAAP
jgi:hypothetical protein